MDGFPRPFRFRLNCIDHYQATPTTFDPQLKRIKRQGQNQAPTVPVIRVFGATESGQKVCAHIHGAFPYLYIPYEGGLEDDEVHGFIESLILSINHALSLSYRRNPYDHSAGTFVAHVSLVRGVPFFGYNVGAKPFLKVYLLNPLHMTRLADLLVQGAVLARFMQPHESHLQYLAQWMCDYNLFGCGFIDCEKVYFRSPVPEYENIEDAKDKWHAGTIRPEWMSDMTEVQRQSHCTLEVDVRVEDITNRREIRPRYIHHDFMERFHELKPDEKFVHSMAGLWRDETIRRKKKMGLNDPGSSPFPPEAMVSMSADPRAEKSDWIHEEEYRRLLCEIINQEKRADGYRDVNFDSFLKSSDSVRHIQSAFESVEDLYQVNLEKADNGYLGMPPSTQESKVLVDEQSISQTLDNIEESYYSDEEVAKEIFFSQRRVKDELLKDSDWPSAIKSRSHAITVEENFSIDKLIQDEETDDIPDRRELDALESKTVRKVLKRKTLQRDESYETFNISIKNQALETTPQVCPQSSPSDSSHKGRAPKIRKVTFTQTKPGSQGASSSSSQLSQSSIKAQGTKSSSTLSFPVVKHAHDPDTQLRLSQRLEYSNLKTSALTAPKTSNEKSDFGSPITPFTNLKLASSELSSGIIGASPVMLQMASHLSKAFPICKGRVFCLSELPPSADEVSVSMLEYGLPPVIYQDAFYGDEKDVPERSREYAGREFRLESTTVPFLADFDPLGNSAAAAGEKPSVVRDKSKEEMIYYRRRKMCSLKNWEYAVSPPSFTEVSQWPSLASNSLESGHNGLGCLDRSPADAEMMDNFHLELSQLDGPTQRNKHGFKYSQVQKKTSVEHETQYMTLMSLEVHVNTRGKLAPDPAEDEISCIAWSTQVDVKTANSVYKTGILVLSDDDGVAKHMNRLTTIEVENEEDELELLNRLVDIVREVDPDILTGFEVHNGSWGYLIERARVKYEFDLCNELSRVKSQSHGRFGKDADRWGFQTTSSIRITGRHMINISRAMRGELNLRQYTMENVVFHLLHKRIPHYAFSDLTRWFRSGISRDIAKTVNYFLTRAQINLQILEANDLIPRTSEQARLLGVDFFSVFSRGSQFKVESIMFRIAKPENYILVSPSRKQVGQQNALECLPLVMEPQSAFYPSPLLVLDFQSLYPSVMIAYNYCYSTFLGRVVNWRGTNKMGFTDFKREPRLLELVQDHINIAPNGIMYVKPEMRKSLLAKMLSEILETRVMIKSGMKEDKDDKILQQLLNNRQLALKLLANVTYGYTSASFSGRMPCSEIADSIVQTGRETLEKAIALIHSVERWGAEVVYGDTDSIFVYLKGRTREAAFDIGQEIAEAVTNANPRPIKLKFEKVYHPCVLLAKKRYVGFKYEHKSQQEPEFDAKGIETVRRDGTPADQKIEEKALKLLFRTQDLSKVKNYFQAQCMKIMAGKVSIQDFLFAREVKLGSYSDRGPPPPGALVATRRMLQDARLEPQYGERVPYVVITGAPGARLIDRCVDPEQLLNNDQLELDAEYYITKNIIPPLERIFNLVGANVRAWYDEMPKLQRIRAIRTPAQCVNTGLGGTKKTLEAYLQSTTCLVCRAKLAPLPALSANNSGQTPPPLLCERCMKQPALVLYALRTRRRDAEKRVRNLRDICRSCSGFGFEDEIKCDSRDCPVFYTRMKEDAAFEHLNGQFGSVVGALERQGFEDGPEW
ncbi:uncharacterized protein PV09_01740 [Verruconis gallopava]|uniref:DNA polymerase n=1 Tax=Verruconis gallopava TaxID=253628 RepID=A0A0D1XYD8_9PEZI|nr:uncharacterized protein PV09_01740 [Verruconis gallopava]KIW07821.1 hypothetical protein PV09_01740 [Verruconis gallopava]